MFALQLKDVKTRSWERSSYCRKVRRRPGSASCEKDRRRRRVCIEDDNHRFSSLQALKLATPCRSNIIGNNWCCATETEMPRASSADDLLNSQSSPTLPIVKELSACGQQSGRLTPPNVLGPSSRLSGRRTSAGALQTAVGLGSPKSSGSRSPAGAVTPSSSRSHSPACRSQRR